MFKYATIGGILITLAIFLLPANTYAVDYCCTCKEAAAGAGCTGAPAQTTSGADQATAAIACETLCGNPTCVSSFSSNACQATAATGAAAGGVVVGFTNPLCPTNRPCTIPNIIGNIIRAILGIVGSIALLMFVYGGFTWMTASGDTEKITKARQVLTWATLGLVVIFASYMLVDFIIKASLE